MGAAEHRCGAEGRVSVQNVGPSISTADATHMCMHYGYTYVCMCICRFGGVYSRSGSANQSQLTHTHTGTLTPIQPYQAQRNSSYRAQWA